VLDRRPQFLDAFDGLRRHEEGAGRKPAQQDPPVFVDEVGLVEHDDLRDVARAHIADDVADGREPGGGSGCATQGDLSNYTNLRIEPPDHGIGRSRGGLSTKIHALTDGKGRPLVVLIGPGQGGDSPMFPLLMGQLRVGQTGPGRARSRPDRLRADKAYSSRAIRSHLRDRGIVAVIPEPSDQTGTANAAAHTAAGLPRSTPTTTSTATSSNAASATRKQWRGIATAGRKKRSFQGKTARAAPGRKPRRSQVPAKVSRNPSAS
jgi:transposase